MEKPINKKIQNLINNNKCVVCEKPVKEQLREFLMSDEGYIPIEEAIKEANKKWPEK